MSNILFTRKHPVLAERSKQLALNLLAIHGGRPYVDARLWRQPNESDLSWHGSSRLVDHGGDFGAVGRKDRARSQNDAGRIAQKIEQYLFADPVDRPGINPAFLADCGGRRSVPRFWQDVSELVTAHGWCWLQADRAAPLIDPGTGKARPRTLAERDRDNDRAVWRLWPASAVVDWRFVSDRLEWLIVEEAREDAGDPEVEPATVECRTVWRRAPQGATWRRLERRGSAEPVEIAAGVVSSPEIPFVLVGRPSSEPWWFDDVESIQAQLLNLDSLHTENLSRSVFPQLIVPERVVASLEARLVEAGTNASGQAIMELQREILRGADRPIVEDETSKGITRYICPGGDELDAIPKEIGRKRGLLFDSVGMALFNRESRQIQTAESKQWDHLDTEATLQTRAKVLQEAEVALVAATKAIDTTFQPYAPSWPKSFNVVDASALASTLVQLANLTLTLTQRKALLRVATRLLSEASEISQEDLQAIEKEIDELKDEVFALPLPPDEPLDTAD